MYTIFNLYGVNIIRLGYYPGNYGRVITVEYTTWTFFSHFMTPFLMSNKVDFGTH